MYACPFQVPNFEWDVRFPLIVKCDMCVSRLAAGEGEPACAATCPTDAIMYGPKESMLEQAHQRIESNPGKYIDHVYGETENGGTATFYVSPVPFEELGFPSGGVVSSAYTNRLVTHGTPAVAGAVAIGLSGVYLTIKHHEEAMAELAKETHGETPALSEVEVAVSSSPGAATPDETTPDEAVEE